MGERCRPASGPMIGGQLPWLGRHLARRIGRRLAGGGHQAQALPAPELVGTSEKLDCPPALYDPDTLSRVISCGFNGTLAEEVAKLEQTSFETRPMALYDLGPAAVMGHGVESRATSVWMGPRSAVSTLTRPVEAFDTLYLANSIQGLQYFGHWLRDDCAAFEHLVSLGDVRSLRRPAWPDCAGYEAIFGQNWREVDNAIAERLVLQRELGFNTDKARRIEALRARLRAALEAPNAGRVVYLKRGDMGAGRNPANEDAVTSALMDAGVVVVTPERGIAETLSTLLDAAIIVTMEGSQAAHGVFALRPGGAMLILQPPRRFYNPHHEWTRLLGMHYATVIGEDLGGGRDFTIKPNEIIAMVERLSAHS
ncbi:MAG: glycosyltransferase family 61 protein [Pseudomonadota bacterium]